jgi:hypothetical protein
VRTPAVDRLPAAPVSRRRFVGAGLGLAGTLTVVGSFGGVLGSCSSDADADAGAPLLALGRTLSKGPDGDRLASTAPAAAVGVSDEASALVALAATAEQTGADLAAGRTVLARGWVLGDTEAAVLVAYARA